MAVAPLAPANQQLLPALLGQHGSSGVGAGVRATSATVTAAVVEDGWKMQTTPMSARTKGCTAVLVHPFQVSSIAASMTGPRPNTGSLEVVDCLNLAQWRAECQEELRQASGVLSARGVAPGSARARRFPSSASLLFAEDYSLTRPGTDWHWTGGETQPHRGINPRRLYGGGPVAEVTAMWPGAGSVAALADAVGDVSAQEATLCGKQRQLPRLTASAGGNRHTPSWNCYASTPRSGGPGTPSCSSSNTLVGTQLFAGNGDAESVRGCVSRQWSARRKHAASSTENPISDDVKGTTSSKMIHPTDLLGQEERVQLSEAVFFSHDPMLHSICRGNTTFVMHARSSCARELAKRQRRRHAEAGMEHRMQGRKWQQRRDQKEEQEKNANARNDTIKSRRLTITDGAKMRLAAALPEQGSAETHSGDANWKGGGGSKARRAIKDRLAQRDKQTKKYLRRQHKRIKNVEELPEHERVELHKAFSAYCTADHMLPHSEMLRCLHELGLAGRTGFERNAIERLCSEIYGSLLQENDSYNISDGPDVSFGRTMSGRSQGANNNNDTPAVNVVKAEKPTGVDKDSFAKGFSQATFSETDGENEADTPKGNERGSAVERVDSKSSLNRKSVRRTGSQGDSRNTPRLSAVSPRMSAANTRAATQPTSPHRLSAVSEVSPHSTLLSPEQSIVGEKTSSATGLQKPHFQQFNRRLSVKLYPYVFNEDTILEAYNKEFSKNDADVQLSITFQDFCTEIVPVARGLLDETREDEYFPIYLHELKGLNEATYGQLEIIATRICISPSMFKEVMREQGYRALDPDTAGHVRSDHSEPRQSSKQPPPLIEWEEARKVFSLCLEREDRNKRKDEQRVKNELNIPDHIFYFYRHELVQLMETFKLFDADATFSLDKDEVMMLLKHKGMQPFNVANSLIINRIWLAGDANGDGEVGFLEFLIMMEKIRAEMQVQRKPVLQRAFQQHSTSHDRLDIKDILKAAIACGLKVRDHEDENIVNKTIEECCDMESTFINFVEFQDIYQRLGESIFRREGSLIREAAKKLGMDMDTMGQYIVAYDSLDTDGSGSLDLEEVKEALKLLMNREPHQKELSLLYAEIHKDTSAELDVVEFLTLVETAQKLKMVPKEPPFLLSDVPHLKLREILMLWPLDNQYIREIDYTTLMDLACDYLEVKVNANLREGQSLPMGVKIGNLGQLRAYAVQKARADAHGS